MTIDEMIAVLTAYKEGKEIEVLDMFDNWVTVTNPKFNFYYNSYRIKQERKMLPFDFTDNLVGKIIKHKIYKFKSIILAQDEQKCALESKYIPYKELFDYCTFLDGSPCGKYIENN